MVISGKYYNPVINIVVLFFQYFTVFIIRCLSGVYQVFNLHLITYDIFLIREARVQINPICNLWKCLIRFYLVLFVIIRGN